METYAAGFSHRAPWRLACLVLSLCLVSTHALAEDRGADHGITFELDVSAGEVLSERAQAALYQIVRESLEGAIRRGPPHTFSVVVAPRDAHLVMTIRDDAPGERRRRSIEVLEERARTLGAALSVAHNDAGSTTMLDLPIYAAPE